MDAVVDRRIRLAATRIHELTVHRRRVASEAIASVTRARRLHAWRPRSAMTTVHGHGRVKATGIAFYDHAEAPLLDDTDTMTPPEIDSVVYTTLDLNPLLAGSVMKALFSKGRPGGVSLVHASFGPGNRLPRHSHSADCLYYDVRGEAIKGSRTVGAGSGFFVRADQPYAYRAGPEGVEVLEFRTETQFDMQVLDQPVERWEPIVAAANENQDRWLADAADR